MLAIPASARILPHLACTLDQSAILLPLLTIPRINGSSVVTVSFEAAWMLVCNFSALPVRAVVLVAWCAVGAAVARAVKGDLGSSCLELRFQCCPAVPLHRLFVQLREVVVENYYYYCCYYYYDQYYYYY